MPFRPIATFDDINGINLIPGITNMMLNWPGENVFICGDFNTSFIENEKRQLARINSRAEIVEITDRLKICRATEMIEHCIDHIFISSNLNMIGSNEITTFLDDDILKDSPHKGICLKFNLQ